MAMILNLVLGAASVALAVYSGVPAVIAFCVAMFIVTLAFTVLWAAER
jgi:hypothetical protein